MGKRSTALKAAAYTGAMALARSTAQKLADRAQEEAVELTKTKIAALATGVKTRDVRRFTTQDPLLQNYLLQLVDLSAARGSKPMDLAALYDYRTSDNRLVLTPASGLNVQVLVPETQHSVRLSLSDEAVKSADKLSLFSFTSGGGKVPPLLEITCPSQDAAEALCAYLLTKMTTFEHVNKITKLNVRHGKAEDITKPLRSLDSVFLAGHVRESVDSALKTFLDSEDRFAKMGRPYSHGFLLYGPPGNGKSSLAQAIASMHTAELLVCHLSSLRDDKELATLVGGAANSTILFEDLDVFRSAVSREATEGVSLSGLLNVLDGPSTPHNSIFVLTTNDLGALADPALLRPGRVDTLLELGYASLEQVAAAALAYTDVPLDLEGLCVAPEVSMAEVTNELLFVPQGTSALNHLVSKGIVWKK